MATHSVSVLIKARDEASKKFNRIGSASRSMALALNASAASIGGAFSTAFTGVISAVKYTFNKITSMFKRMAAFTWRWAKRAALGLSVFGGYAVKMAMDAEESENLFEVSMGGMANATRKWSEEIAKSLGLNSYEIRRMVSTLNVMLGSMGIAPKKAAAMSQEMTKLTYDMASFYNLKPEEAFAKLQSGITGEMEPLKRLGILVGENTTKAWALREGIIKKGQALTETQKVLARYNVILEQTQKAQGDLERTSDSTTNVFRALKSQLKLVSIEIGKVLLPAVTKATIRMKEFLIENRERIVQFVEKVYSGMVLVKDIFVAYIDFMRRDWREGFSKSLDATIAIFKGFGRSLMVVMKKIFTDIGSNINVWIHRGLARRKTFAKLRAQAYAELREVVFPESKGPIITLHGPTIKKMTKEKIENVKKQADELARQRLSAMEEAGYFVKKYPALVSQSWGKVGEQIKAISKKTWETLGGIMPDFAKNAEAAFARFSKRMAELKEKGRMPTITPGGPSQEPSEFAEQTAIGRLVSSLQQQLQPREARLLTTASGAKYDFDRRTESNTKRAAKYLGVIVTEIKKSNKLKEKRNREGTQLSVANFS